MGGTAKAGRAAASKAAAPKAPTSPTPAPAPAPEVAVETPAPAPVPEVATETSAPAAAELPQEAAPLAAPSTETISREDVEAADPRASILGRAHDALHEGLDALQAIFTNGAFITGRPSDGALVAAAERGFAAITKAFEDARDDVANAVSLLRYEGLERRSFELVKDVLLDGTHYGPSHEEQIAPLTETQHAELKAALAVEAAWDAGEPDDAE